MTGFFDRMLGRNKEPGSANKAKERLQFVLAYDRVDIPPERLQMMKEEIVAVISKYVAVTGDEVEIALEQRDRKQNRLIAEVPFIKPITADPDEDAPYSNISAMKLDVEDEGSLALPLLDEPFIAEETQPNRRASDISESDASTELTESDEENP